MWVKLVEGFLKSSTELLNECESALKEGRHDEAARAAHKLIASSKSFGAKGFGEHCFEVERVIKSERIDDARSAFRDAQAEYRRVSEELSRYL